jgi:signal peptidase II
VGYYSVIFLLVIGADQLTKLWILQTFELYQAKEIIPGFFNLVYVTNTGAAFSMLAGVDSPWRHYFFLCIGVIAFIGLTIAAYRFRASHRGYVIALALIAGGAVGNFIDRLRYGSVVDFLDFYYGSYHWPAFNVADSAICVGAVLFLLVNILEERKNTRSGA